MSGTRAGLPACPRRTLYGKPPKIDSRPVTRSVGTYTVLVLSLTAPKLDAEPTGCSGAGLAQPLACAALQREPSMMEMAALE